MNMNLNDLMNKNKFRKLLIVAFAVTVLMLTSGVANAIVSGGNIEYIPAPSNFLKVSGYTETYCDPAEGCYGTFAEIEMNLYQSGVQIGYDYDYVSNAWGDDVIRTASIAFNYYNPDLSKPFTAVLEHWGYTDTYGSYHDFTYLTYP